MAWSATQYQRFEAERTRPVRDLLAATHALISQPVENVVDLGCGPGNSTQVLHQHFPQAHIQGLDNDDNMLRTARQRLPGIEFLHVDIADWHAEKDLDVILANASLQWLPNHQMLYPHLLQQLRTGGTLAVQTPDNLQEPAHQFARKIATNFAWSDRLNNYQLPVRHDAAWYYSLLKPLARHVEVWRTTYMHALQNHQAVVEWFKGSALRPYLALLSREEQEVFLEEYLQAITSAYPELADGTVLLPFPRLFLVAKR